MRNPTARPQLCFATGCAANRAISRALRAVHLRVDSLSSGCRGFLACARRCAAGYARVLFSSDACLRSRLRRVLAAGCGVWGCCCFRSFVVACARNICRESRSEKCLTQNSAEVPVGAILVPQPVCAKQNCAKKLHCLRRIPLTAVKSSLLEEIRPFTKKG